MATIDAAAQLALREAREICAVPAPPFQEDARAAFVASRFAALGLRVRRDVVGNVIAELPATTTSAAAAPASGERALPVVFAAHLDTVFDGATDIVFQDAGDRLYAPGIGDNSLGVAALLHLARDLIAGAPLTDPVALVATVGEEGLGDLRGAKALVHELPMQAFVAVEGSMADAITVAGVGSIRFGVTVRGPGGHPWGDRERPSAVHAIVAALDAAIAVGGADLGDADLVLNVGTIEGGTAVNAIAGGATATLELRCEDDAVLQRAAARVHAAMKAAIPDGLDAVVEQIGHRPGGRLPTDHPLVVAARAARTAAGLPPVAETGSSTDANAAHGRGIPAITVGITTGGDAHTLREYIDLPPVGAGLRALSALAGRLVRGE